jgi:ribonuclease HI
MSKKTKIKAFFDGCCEPVNPGGIASYGAVIFIDDVRVWECSEIFYPEKGKEKETSNNVAEYLGFLAILQYLLDNNLHKEYIIIHGDSKLVIEQMKGEWRMVKGFYKTHALKAKELFKQFKKTKLEWIPRDKNDIADELSKAELKKAGVKFKLQPED